jgi:A/G-specific adenine glycosylase
MSETGIDPLDDVDVAAAQTSLLAWYEEHSRDFPWRETTEPWAILVSEVMSQQTQLDRIVEPWTSFLDRWPTAESLAAADRADVVSFWSEHSLGYNNRARYLHEAATEVVESFDGELPADPTMLEELMGVGPYTANAVASFAFNNGDAVVDTNVKRVLYRAFDIPDSDAAYDRVASTLLPTGESRRWNNAVMELGGTACDKQPRCDEAACPWRDFCSAYRSGDFTAPDVPTQEPFEGSRRQYRGRIVRTLGEETELGLDALGRRIRVDYDPDGEHGREWLRDLLSDLAGDGLVALDDSAESTTVRLRQ